MSKAPEERFLEDCRRGLDEARALLPRILDVSGPRTLDNTLAPYHDLLIAVSRSSATAGLHSEVHPDEKVRDAARTVEQEVSAFVTDLQLDRGVYDALAAVPVDGLDAE